MKPYDNPFWGFEQLYQETKNNNKKKKKISASADGGPRSRVCARLTVRSSPHRHERKLSGTRVCRVTFKHLPQPLKSNIRSFGTLGRILKFSIFFFKKPKNVPQGARGGLRIFLGVNISFFCENKPPVKFQNSN